MANEPKGPKFSISVWLTSSYSLSGLTVWVTVTGILALSFDAAPWWVGVGFIVLGVGANRVLSARDPKQVDAEQPAT